MATTYHRLGHLCLTNGRRGRHLKATSAQPWSVGAAALPALNPSFLLLRAPFSAAAGGGSGSRGNGGGGAGAMEAAGAPSVGTDDEATLSSSSSSLAAEPIASAPKNSLLTNLAELSKARLSALVVSTTACGFLAAGPIALSTPALPTLAAASAGTALCAASAATLNQLFEIDRDKRMKRTAKRPLPSGNVTPNFARGAAVATGGAGAAVLFAGTDPLSTLLGVGNVALYAGPYTSMKPRSEWNTWVGAVVGAVPPVLGWTAAGGSPFDAEAVLLGSALFLWQFPHFMALNWMHRVDYARGGFQMVATNDPDGDRTSDIITKYGWYLASLPVVSTLMGVTSPMFAVEGVVLNAYALTMANRFDKDRTNGNARKVFLTSLWYLPCFMTLFLIHSRRWHENEDEETVATAVTATGDDGAEKVSGKKKEDSAFFDWVRRIQSKGRDLCLHEAVASKDVEIFAAASSSSGTESKTPIDGSKCPVTALGKKATATVAAAIPSRIVVDDGEEGKKSSTAE